jgi:hypothetical protein
MLRLVQTHQTYDPWFRSLNWFDTFSPGGQRVSFHGEDTYGTLETFQKSMSYSGLSLKNRYDVLELIFP